MEPNEIRFKSNEQIFLTERRTIIKNGDSVCHISSLTQSDDIKEEKQRIF